MPETPIPKKAWLDKLFYEIGKQVTDFRVCTTYLKEGEQQFSKWIPYMEAQGNEKIINECNQREQLKNEIILDLDKGNYNKLIEKIKKDELKFYAYSTEEGRAKQIHLYFDGLIVLDKLKREKIREYLISKYKCDLSFKIDSHMVPIEYERHWKTGKTKVLIEKVDGINNLSTIVDEVNRLERKKKIDDKKKDKEAIRTSLYIDKDKGIFAEQVYDGEESKFCIYNLNSGEISYEEEIIDILTYKPITDEEVDKKAILLPSKAEEYGDDEKLDNQIINYINKWLDIDEDFKRFALWNIKRSWVFERFHTLNYLRALGDSGLGKTRFIDTLGYIHYKPIATSGATTSAPIFRIIEKWRGSLIMDEADFDKSDESQDIIKIINQGYEKGKFIMRCDKNNPTKIEFFDPYCPKILATRNAFSDKATESRCMTRVMGGTNRKDIPLNLNQTFWEETLTIRNKLLLWRFHNFFKIDLDCKIDFDLGDLEPRVEQIVSSFIVLFKDKPEQLQKFKEFIKNHQESIIDERRNSFAGSVVGCIYNLINNNEININAQDIIIEGDLKDLRGHILHPRGLSSILKSLGFGKTKSVKIERSTKRCISLEKEHLVSLFKRYGYEVTMVTIDRLLSEKQKELDKGYDGYGVTVVGGEPPKVEIEEVLGINENDIEKTTGHRNNRNNRNSVTENEKEAQNEPRLVTMVTMVTDKGILNEEQQKLSDNDLLMFIEEKGSKGYQATEFIEKYGENRLKTLLEKGDVMENPRGILRLLK